MTQALSGPMANLARILVGVDLHLSVCEKLVLVQEDLKPIISQRGADVEWTPVLNMVLGMRVASGVERSLIRHLKEALQSVTSELEPFLFLTQGIGAWPDGETPRILFAGCTEGREALVEMNARIEGAFQSLGLAPDRRPYHPQITLGRVRTPEARADLSDVAKALRDVSFGATEVLDVAIYESHLTPKGAQYRILTRAHLKGVRERLETLA